MIGRFLRWLTRRKPFATLPTLPPHVKSMLGEILSYDAHHHISKVAVFAPQPDHPDLPVQRVPLWKITWYANGEEHTWEG